MVIPKAIREKLGLVPGQRVQAFAYGGRIELIPVRPLKEMRGFLAVEAARLSLETRLPMADSIVLATARASGATLWTEDADFEGLPSVQFRGKKA